MRSLRKLSGWIVGAGLLAALAVVPAAHLGAEPEKEKYEVGFNNECNWPCVFPPKCSVTV